MTLSLVQQVFLTEASLIGVWRGSSSNWSTFWNKSKIKYSGYFVINAKLFNASQKAEKKSK